MNVVKESLIGRIFLWLWYAYNESAFQHCMDRFWRTCRESALVSGLLGECTLTRAWKDSFTCRAMNWVINLPANILHHIYCALRGVMDKSFFANLAFGMGDEAAVAASWLMALLMMIPYERWNNAYSFVGFFLVLLLVIAGGMRRKELRLDMKLVNPYLVFFAGAVVFSAVFSRYVGLSGRFLLYHATCMLCVVVTVSAVKTAAHLVRLAGGAAMGVLVTSLYGVYQRIQGVEVNESYVDIELNAGMPGRVFSVFDNPNAFGEVLVILLPVVLALVFCSKHFVSRVAALGVFCIGAVALIMTYSRAGWIGFAFSLVVFVFLWDIRFVPICAVLAVCCVPMLPDTVMNRIGTITNLSDSSTSSRFPLYAATIELIQKSPVRGAGLGTAAVQKYILDHNLYHAEAPYVHAHNIYLQVWAETGLWGIVSFITAMWSCVRGGICAVMNAKCREARLITVGGVAALSGALVCAIADYLWNYPRVMCIFWFLIALILAGIKTCKTESEKV